MRRTPRHGQALSAAERHLAVMGPPPAEWEKWAAWDRAVGPWFRQRHGLPAFWAGDADRLEREPVPAEPWPLPPAAPG